MGPDLGRLAADARAGDAAALAALLAALRPDLVRTVRLVVGAGLDCAEDAAQEALLDITNAISTLQRPEAVRAWALRIATRRALRAARRERALRRVPGLLAREYCGDASVSRSQEIMAAFQRLPPRLRAVAVLRLFLGLDETETAIVLGCSRGTVKSQLHDARDRLSSMLADDYRSLAVKPKRITEAPG
jgi:RNA polymerase sigma-70 factor (ECF subfamily)